jgi:hypothetical protein
MSIWGLHKKLWASKRQESQFHEKCHLGVAFVVSHKEYYKGEGGGFPQVWAMGNLMNPCMPMIHPCTKNPPTMH